MDAIIVAAGMGKRLKGLTTDKPKCMLEIDGISIFTRQTDLFLENGITDINVVVGYKKECFTDKRFKYFVNNEYRKNNILHSLFYAEEAMDSGFLFSYSDIVYDGPLEMYSLREALQGYLKEYNTFRPHQSLNQATPMAYYQQYLLEVA